MTIEHAAEPRIFRVIVRDESVRGDGGYKHALYQLRARAVALARHKLIDVSALIQCLELVEELSAEHRDSRLQAIARNAIVKIAAALLEPQSKIAAVYAAMNEFETRTNWVVV